LAALEDVADNLPVLAEPRPIERRPVVSVTAAVAAATGGFLLGIATFVMMRVLRRPKPVALRLGKRRKKTDIAASRSFLVDIHLLKDR
jgi:ABC-type transport system involved in cytochrome c biogenesis permease subunit